ncbi:MAG TPA: phospholipase D-like domain-containing protein [Candidatus Acidoferrales bacterium]|nr:phospholipase D-like domain-containing protein [Candidatus Acidoferrales bacterium]
MSHTLLVMPDDTAKPVVEAIRGAKKSIRVKMFLFSHSELVDALIEAKKRGVHVRVMLNPARRSGESENAATHKKLKAAGIDVIDTNPDFDVTHEKSMVVDDEVAYIKSFNWDLKNLTETRDYAVVTTHPPEVAEVIKCFDADWVRKPFKVGSDALLIWCNANGRERIARFIDEAKHTLFAQNERYQDSVIIERLVRAKERGVKVHVMARPPHKLKKEKLTEGVGGLRILDDVGIKVHKLKHLKLHGKMLLADHSRAIIGSINLAPGSFDSRRELAIEVHSPEVVERLRDIAHHDWKHSHPFDLTDAGLLAELEEHKIDAAEALALQEGHGKERKKKR